LNEPRVDGPSDEHMIFSTDVGAGADDISFSEKGISVYDRSSTG